jgi:hypothetical protein
MGLLMWVVIAVVVLAIIGLGVGTFFSGVMRGAEIAANNPVVRNATDEAKDFVKDKVDDAAGGSNGPIQMTTDKTQYRVGETVVITVKNNGAETLDFPDSALGLEIVNNDTGTSYSIFAAQVITSIEPGQSRSVVWNSGDGEPVEPRSYTATVHTTPRGSGPSGQISFELT